MENNKEHYYISINEENNFNTELYIVLAFLILFIGIILFYFSFFLFKYFIPNAKSFSNFYNSNKLFCFWIDYIEINIMNIILLFVYFFYIIKLFLKKKIEDNIEIIFGQYFPEIVILLILMFLAIMIIGFIFSNLYRVIIILIKMNEISKINSQDIKTLSDMFKKNDISSYYKNQYHVKENIIFIIINFFLLCFFHFLIKILVNENYEKTTNKFQNTVNNIFGGYPIGDYILFLECLTIFLLISVFASIYLIKHFKTKLLENNYYSKNILLQKIYYINSNRIIYFADIITFKTLFDLVAYFPLLFYFFNRRLDILGFVIGEICMIIYAILQGTMNIFIDKLNNKKNKKNYILTKFIQKIFFVKSINLSFGENELVEFYTSFNFEYSEEENEILQELDMTIGNNFLINNKKKKIVNDNFDNILIDEKNSKEINPNKSTTSSLSKLITKDKNIDFNSPSIFFIVYKILYKYYNINKNIYINFEKNFNEDGLPFKEISNNDESIDNEYLLKMERMNILSKLNEKKFIINASFNQGEIFQSIEEKEFRENFKKFHNLKDVNYIKFNIENIFNEILFELYPFYQISINDIIESLNPILNKNFFFKFSKNNKNNEELNKNKKENDNKSNFSKESSKDEKLTNLSNKIISLDSNLDNNENKKEEKNKDYNNDINKEKNNKNNDQNNENSNKNTEIFPVFTKIFYDPQNQKEYFKNFYTYNNLLYFEAYNSEEISLEQLNNFLKEYKSYLQNTIKTIGFSNLPLILGIYNISYNTKIDNRNFNNNIILFVYRNPLYFTKQLKMNHWINIIVTETPEKNSESSQNDILNINEIEIKDKNIKLNENDYNEIKTNLKKDIKFIIENSQLKIFPVINIFIAIENNNDPNESNFLNESNLNNNEFNNNNMNNLINNLNMSSVFEISNIKPSKKNKVTNNSNKSEIYSLFEKEYYCQIGDDIYTIKLFFSNFFRKSCTVNKDEDEKFLLNTESYCKYIENQIDNYIYKKESIFNDEK